MFAAVAIFTAASCQKEMANEPLENNGGEQYTFSATILETKTVLAEGNKVNWSVGDNISVFDKDNQPVEFQGQHETESASAVFHADTYNKAETIYAIYPSKADAKFDGTIISALRVAGTQTAVEGSFDKTYAVLFGKEINENNLSFSNIHSLIKFTIDGKKAPEKVVFTNGGSRNIAGLFTYNTSSGVITPDTEYGAKSITLKPADGESFKIGETYYIAFIPGGNLANMTLAFDETVVKTIEGPKYATDANNHFIGKIIDFGTLSSDPVEFELERVAARYSDGANAWCSFIPGIANRTMASDGKYVYLQSSEATAKVYAVEIASLLNGDATPTYKTLSTKNMSGGTHAVSTLRCIPNESGDPILIATNLAVDGSQNFNIYAYSNGTDADPVLFHAYRWDGVYNATDWRRYGDRISVSGTWQNGSIWAASQSGTKVMGFHIENGITDASLREYCWFDTFTGGLAEATLYPGAKEAIVTTASKAGFWTPNTNGEKHPEGNWPQWDAGEMVEALNGVFSFQFFTYNEKNYIAYVQLTDNAHANLVVVEDKGSFEASLTSTKLISLPLYEGDKASCTAGNTYGDCAVVTINEKLHIVAMMQGGGLSIFEIKDKQ